MKRIGLMLMALFLMQGCVSIASINKGFQKIDRAWALEYQKTENTYRYRVVDAPFLSVFKQVKKTFLDLSMPIQTADIANGFIKAQNEAPHPLTKEEWREVAKIENPRVKKLGGWMFTIPDDPSDYIVTITAKLRPVGSKTFVLLEYKLNMPEYERNGMTPSKYAPPLAVQLGSTKFWKVLSSNLGEAGLPLPRKRSSSDLMARL